MRCDLLFLALSAFLDNISQCINLATVSDGEKNGRRTTIVVMVDGLANWVLDSELTNPKTNTLGFQQIIQDGVRADYLLPEFPTKTLPNYYSFATGLFPGNHEIIGNYMYDRNRRAYFSNMEYHSDLDLVWWNASDPIWVTAARQNVGTALYWWPGCQVQFGDLNLTSLCPRSSRESAESFDLMNQIPVILQKISHENLKLVFIGYSAVEQQSHENGPGSGMAKQKLEQISDVLFTLQHAMQMYNMFDSVNLLVVSTQGMSPVALETSLYFLDDYLDSMNLLDAVVDNGSWMLLYPKLGKDYEVYQQLSNVPHTKLYWKDQLLTRWNLKEAKFLPPLLLICDAGFGIYCRNCGDKQFPRISSRVRNHLSKGISGYDNAAEEMHAIFMARGPDFKSKHKHRWIRMTDVYQILCHTARLSCRDSDGDWDRVADMLNLASSRNPSSYLVLCIFVALFSYVIVK